MRVKEAETKIRSTPITRAMPWGELLRRQRDYVCKGCGGKLSIRTINNWGCGEDPPLYSRNQLLICASDYCGRIENGIERKAYRKLRRYVIRRNFTYWEHKNDAWKDGKLHPDFYGRAQNTHRLAEIYADLKGLGLFSPLP